MKKCYKNLFGHVKSFVQHLKSLSLQKRKKFEKF